MKIRASSCYLLVVLTLLKAEWLCAQTGIAMDRDLLEVTVPQLEQLYRSHKYTVTQVVRWYIAHIEKYNGIYRAVQNLYVAGALATAAREDADAKTGGASLVRGPCGAFRLLSRQTPDFDRPGLASLLPSRQDGGVLHQECGSLIHNRAQVRFVV
jgi:hypothetical protein